MSQVKLNTQRLFLIPKKSIKPKRVDTGLYHGKRIGTGHYRSFSERKTQRKFMPNVHYVKLYSEIIGQRIRVKATTQVLRIVDKLGGLDNYLLHYKPEKIDSQFGVWLRDKVEKQLKLNQQFASYKDSVELYAQQLAQEMLDNPQFYQETQEQESDVYTQTQQRKDLLRIYLREEMDANEAVDVALLEEKLRQLQVKDAEEKNEIINTFKTFAQPKPFSTRRYDPESAILLESDISKANVARLHQIMDKEKKRHESLAAKGKSIKLE